MSKQLEYQARHKKLGLCIYDNNPARISTRGPTRGLPSNRCEKCHEAAMARQRARKLWASQ
jgi:hypothetical protein